MAFDIRTPRRTAAMAFRNTAFHLANIRLRSGQRKWHRDPAYRQRQRRNCYAQPEPDFLLADHWKAAIVATCFRESQLFIRVSMPLNLDYFINRAIGDVTCLLTIIFS
jgi:hypothetical protein